MAFPTPQQQPNLPEAERAILERWRQRRVLERSLEQTADGPRFRFYEGPPTANGVPGVHHVEARVFKDVFVRYRTMLGEHVPRPAGWDCHGIPVELEVERQLGMGNKSDIENYGVAAFNEACRESVRRYVGEFERLTERIGYWLDARDAYWTMSRPYIESVWWSLKQLHDSGMIYEDDRVVPYCPRCGTALSDHEVAQGYAETDDPSIFVRFPVITGPLAAEGVDLLVWTTMPWTLIPATLAVVGPDIDYVVADGGRAGDRPVVVAADRVAEALGDGVHVLRRLRADDLVGARYQAPFDFVGPGSRTDPDGDPASWRFVVADEFVRTDEGTGIVHTGAAYGHDDMRVARVHGVPVVKPVDRDGRFNSGVGAFAGMYVRDADEPIIKHLASANLLVHAGTARHTFPFCWRCSTPLLYYAKPCWYIATTRLRDRMLQENAAIDWRPAHIRDGRFGDWLANNVDWAVSRERYWGTPLPFWRCSACDRTLAVGSVAELGELSGLDLDDFDPHRPGVDTVALPCDACGGQMARVPEVIDAWYDSGAMPFAQFGYPHEPGSIERFEENFPADCICEAVDQTRGWFYSLLAESTLLFDRSGFARALCVGHIVDDDGQKMSKSAGNVLEPWALVERHGADALRWLLLVEGSPWQSRRVSDDSVRDAARRVLHTVWNVHYFFVTYANLAGWEPEPGSHAQPQHVMDRWLLAELADTTVTVRASLDDFDATGAGRRIGGFVDDLSNWYVRRIRQRVSARTTDEPGRTAALETLYRCLVDLAQLIAPFAPFLADHLHENLTSSTNPASERSVHLRSYPRADEAHADPQLLAAMRTARRLVSLGRDARNTARIPVRQPLRRAVVSVPEQTRHSLAAVVDVIAEELNVKEVQVASGGDKHVSRSLKPNFSALGPVFGSKTPVIARALGGLDAEQAARELAAAGAIKVEVGGETAEVTAEQVEVVEDPDPGWSISSDGTYEVLLDTAIDEELELEGTAREFARLANDLRRQRRLEVGSQIVIKIQVVDDPSGAIAAMLNRHADALAADVAAQTLEYRLEPVDGFAATRAGAHLVDIAGGSVALNIEGKEEALP